MAVDVAALQQYYGKIYEAPAAEQAGTTARSTGSRDFGAVFDAAMNVLDETNALQNNAENEEIRFALGEADNTHDLAIAQQKALTALQYTVAIRDRFIQGYQEIMQMQI